MTGEENAYARERKQSASAMYIVAHKRIAMGTFLGGGVNLPLVTEAKAKQKQRKHA